MLLNAVHLSASFWHRGWMVIGNILMVLCILSIILRDILSQMDTATARVLAHRLLFLATMSVVGVICVLFIHISQGPKIG